MIRLSSKDGTLFRRMRLSCQHCKDHLVWSSKVNGEYLFKTTYYVARGIKGDLGNSDNREKL